jgi:HTH-type transcriptional regulator/antitoxin HipB
MKKSRLLKSEFLKVVGSRLTVARMTAGITQRAIAERLGVSQSAISHYELGLTDISMRQFGMYCHALGVKVTDILEGLV